LNKAFNDALSSQRVKDTLAQFGMDPRGSTPEEFSQLTQKDIDRKGPILRATNPNK
jgi:tripartite-type tricarboxylate transporter receptor subunit TctC